LTASGPFTGYLPLVLHCYDGVVPPFGIAMYGPIDDDAGLQEMEDAHLSWVTTFVRWSDVEPVSPTNGTHTYNWSTYDTKFANAVAAGLRPIALIAGNPAWAAEYPGGPVTDTNHLKAFLGALVERYDGDGFADAPGSLRVQHWMLYPEPDNGDEQYALAGKGYWGHIGDQYAEMLCVAREVMKAADPEAQIMIAGLAYDWFEEDGGPFVRHFLPDVLEAGGGACIDLFAFHFYPIRQHEWPTIREKAAELRGILDAHGLSSIEMIVPELGFWSAEEVGSSEEDQANRLVKMLVRAMSVDLKIINWWAVFDAGSGALETGLLRADDSPKPAYYAYKTVVSELTGARFERILETEYESIEGYVFSIRGGERETGVLWTNSANGEEVFRELSFPVACVRVVEKDGVESTIFDGEIDDLDGTTDGWVRMRIGGSPIYVEACP